MLEVKKLSLTIDKFSLVNIALAVDKGDYFVLLGPTGNGKTVLLECIAGRHIPNSGEIWIDGENVVAKKPNKRHIGYVVQDYALFPHLSVKENISLGLKVRKIASSVIKKEVKEIAEVLNISSLLDRMPRDLSGGEKQRVALARALIIKPKVLLLDEPLSALDPITHEKCLWELKRLHEEVNITTLHVSHNFQEVFALANKIGIIKDGRLIQTGTLQELFNNPKSTFVAEFTGAKNIFKGRCVENKPDKSRFDIGKGINIWGPTNKNGKTEKYICIDPENISLSTSRLQVSMDGNTLQGEIKSILPQKKSLSIQIDVGLIVTSIVTPCEFETLKAGVGDQVFLGFDKEAIRYY